ncbi:MAG TPA: tripartite tricarboxylate transporter substrate-binding protein [Xanthobacteraceae bacterium]|jgi:tripartite-type tricarboxylate transporter receptor subunit TctC
MAAIRSCRNGLGVALSIAAVLAIGLDGLRAQSDPAANYPSRPIRIIVPFAAGGGNDIFARLVGQKLADVLKATVVTENRPAAAGRPAAQYVLREPADGYTLFIAASGVMSVSAAIYPDLPYQPTKSFIPLTMVANFPLILVDPISNPAKTVAELVAYAKAHPEKSNYASSSPAFTIASELLKLKTGMPGVAIPWKSSNEMLLCVASEQCLFTIADGPPTVPMVKGGKVRALAVTGAERSPELPDVPSMAEAGYPEVNTKLWSGFFVAAGTPPAIATKLETALRAAIRDPQVSARLRGMAVNPGATSSKEFRAMIDADIKSYEDVVKAANLKFEE